MVPGYPVNPRIPPKESPLSLSQCERRPQRRGAAFIQSGFPGDDGELKNPATYTTYATGISAMCFASAAELEPEMVATIGGGAVMTYEDITAQLAAWLTGNQQETGCAEGGWTYYEKETRLGWGDNSISS